MRFLKEMEHQVEAAPDQQVSLTDPDARSMATSGKGTGVVGYNVQAAVDTEHHLIVAHEVTNLGHDRTQLVPMGRKARQATGCGEITVLADRGYFNGDQVLACEGTGVLPCVPNLRLGKLVRMPAVSVAALEARCLTTAAPASAAAAATHGTSTTAPDPTPGAVASIRAARIARWLRKSGV